MLLPYISVIYEIEIKPKNRNKISAKVMKDEDTVTCITLRTQHSNFYIMKVDVSTYPLEGTSTFYFKVTHQEQQTFHSMIG